MATLNIPQTPQYATLIAMIEDIMNPSAKTMREFKEKLNESELALIFNSIQDKCITPGSKKGPRSATSKVSKAPRNSTKAAEDDVRCEALVFAYEMNAEGKLVPSRCKRCVEENTKFCKQHGAADGKPWKCKERGDIETTHEFKWQHLGTVHDPSPIFELEKAKIELLKNFKAKQLLSQNTEDTIGSDDENSQKIIKKTKTTKTSEKATKQPKSKKTAEEKPKKRVANGYIFYKSLKHQEIKEQLIAENPELKGKELANKITTVASEQWKQLSEAEQANYKQQSKDSIAASVEETSSSQEQVDEVDTPLAALEITTPKSQQEEEQVDESSQVEIPELDDDDDEEDTMVFNQKFNVWVDTDNNLCYETKDTNPGPIGQVQRGQFLKFPSKKK